MKMYHAGKEAGILLPLFVKCIGTISGTVQGHCLEHIPLRLHSRVTRGAPRLLKTHVFQAVLSGPCGCGSGTLPDNIRYINVAYTLHLLSYIYISLYGPVVL